MAASLLWSVRRPGLQGTHRHLSQTAQAQGDRPPLPRGRPNCSASTVPDEFIEKTLTDLGFSPQAAAKGAWRVQVPSFRVDIEREADLIEEIARFFGYDKIPVVVPPLEVLEPVPSDRARIERLSRQFFHYGFDEVVNAELRRSREGSRPGHRAGRRSTSAIRSPSTPAILRTTLLGGLLENLRQNRNHGAEGVHIFEIGKIFCWADESATPRT